MSEATSSNERDVRIQKLEEWRNLGVDPFTPRASSARTAFSTDIVAQFEAEESNPPKGTLYGRILLHRAFGKAAFMTIRDEKGTVQIYFKQEDIGEEAFKQYKLLDLGDFIAVSGEMFRTKHGEPTLKVSSFEILSKALRPMPEKFHGLEDIETRYRKRYLDLLSHPDVKDSFVVRSKLVYELRRYLIEERGFLEVETPMMHTIAGGAAARPFITHHNALDMDLYLRIAPELFLKRLVVGGMHKVFEINRNFRNEGIDTTHNPEFTMIELYEAFSDWRGMADLFKDVVAHLTKTLRGTTKISYQGYETDLSVWREASYGDLLLEKGIDMNKIASKEEALAEARKRGIEVDPALGQWEIIAELFDELIGDHIQEPTIVYDYPAAISPLSKRNPSNPNLAERFEAYAFGFELCNGFSELNNALTQRQIFEDQATQKASGNEEAMSMDEDFCEALEQGLPPTGGIGIGIDRLTMVMIDTASIRDVILFPTMKHHTDGK
ncbi:MAG: lysine--tRNA ligase [Brevinema sp.]